MGRVKSLVKTWHFSAYLNRHKLKQKMNYMKIGLHLQWLSVSCSTAKLNIFILKFEPQRDVDETSREMENIPVDLGIQNASTDWIT